MADMHSNAIPEPTEQQLQSIRDRMGAFIFPNTPITDSEKAAFEKAVQYQYEHEASVASSNAGMQIPDGVKRFSIGEFSMEFEDGTCTSQITKKTICSSAYGILLREGLLYRGVEGRG